MDNFGIDITGEGRKIFTQAMEIAFSQHPHALGYRIDGSRLIFLWVASRYTAGNNSSNALDPAVVAFPFKMDASGAAEFANRWLAEQDYGEEPDHDGSNGRGFRVFNEGWGHVKLMSGATEHYAIVAVEPAWAVYGK